MTLRILWQIIWIGGLWSIIAGVAMAFVIGAFGPDTPEKQAEDREALDKYMETWTPMGTRVLKLVDRIWSSLMSIRILIVVIFIALVILLSTVYRNHRPQVKSVHIYGPVVVEAERIFELCEPMGPITE